MGFFSNLFSSKDSDCDIKVREKSSDNSVVRANKYEHTPTESNPKAHVDRGYNLDKQTGSYREYGGGENSQDRTYNKK